MTNRDFFKSKYTMELLSDQDKIKVTKEFADDFITITDGGALRFKVCGKNMVEQLHFTLGAILGK